MNGKKIKDLPPSWRPDLKEDIDLIEELTRIKGYDKVPSINPEKETAFPMSIISLIIRFDGFNKNWKKINVRREVKITKTILKYNKGSLWSIVYSVSIRLERGENVRICSINVIVSLCIIDRLKKL